MYVADKNTVRRAEGLTVERGGDWFTLMQNAGKAAAGVITAENNVAGKTVLILCGKGNNGGDGFIIAKELSFAGAEVTVVLTQGAPATEIARQAFDGMPGEVKVVDMDTAVLLCAKQSFDITVDAVFGTGFSGVPDDDLKKLFSEVSISDFAIDIPSGLYCDTGEGAENALPTRHTVTFAAYKPCHILPAARNICSEVTCVDIGISHGILELAGATVTVIEKPLPRLRDKNSFKNTYGTALSVCGSYGMPGAAIISAKAALRSGVGILKLACVEENYTACAVSLPEAVLLPCPTRGKTYSSESADALKEALKTADALLIGCGMGISEDARTLVKELLKTTTVPTVLDADGINLIASDIELLKDVKAPLILTPHPGEMARLMGTSPKDIESDRLGIAAGFAKKFGLYLVLKGSNTIVASPSGELSVNLTGNPGMATAGSGDMLAGIILALLAKGFDPCVAAKSAVWYHSAAGDAAKARLGEESMLPTDMIEELYRSL